MWTVLKRGVKVVKEDSRSGSALDIIEIAIRKITQFPKCPQNI